MENTLDETNKTKRKQTGTIITGNKSNAHETTKIKRKENNNK